MSKDEEVLQGRADLHRAILDQLHEGVYLVDRDRKILYWNEGAERVSGYSADEVIGFSCSDNILVHVDQEGTSLCLEGCPLEQTMKDSQPQEAEAYLHHKQGHRVPVQIRTAALKDDSGRVIGGIETFSENLARPAMREEIETLRRLALQDELTEIGNRRYTEMALQSRHNEFDRYGWNYGVLMIDIDHFKLFNDQYGHDIGDRVLRIVAATLSSNVRTFDVVGRWGGEEFLAVIEKIDPEGLSSRAEILRQLVESSGLTIDDQQLSVTVSIGGAVAGEGETVNEVVKRADVHLYQSKASGRNRCTVDA